MTEDLHWPCVSSSPFQRQLRQRAVPGEGSRGPWTFNCSSLKKYPQSLQTRSAPQSRTAVGFNSGPSDSRQWGWRACLTCPAVPVSIKLYQLRVGPAAGGSLCNSDRPRAANTAGNKWPCKRFSKRFGKRDAGQRSTKTAQATRCKECMMENERSVTMANLVRG